MPDIKDFFNEAKTYLEKAKLTQKENILSAAQMMFECMEDNGIVQLFGIDAGRAFSMELGYRAGGLMPFHQFNVKDLVLRGKISEEEFKDVSFNDQTKYAQMLFDLYHIEKTDMFIFISDGANEPLIVECALIAKKQGAKIISVVNKKMAEKATVKHSSNKKLTDIADLVIDNCADEYDCILAVDEKNKINQVGTICGNVIAQMLTAETYNVYQVNNKECPVLLSANVKGADVHNRNISDKYAGRWNS